MAFVGVAMSRLALDIMDTPADVIDQSVLYMRIYFMGMPFFMLYNYGAAILRAVGDTKRPLLFLAAAGMANVALDLLLVVVIPLDVAGVAIGTVASQMVSSVLVLRCLYKTDSSYQLRFSKLRIRAVHLKRIFQVGIPAGIQSTVINFSNAMLQSSVNSFGATAMAGYTAANNILGFLYVSVNAVTQACMSLQARTTAWASRSAWTGVLLDCLILSVGAAGVLGVGAYVFGSRLLGDLHVGRCGDPVRAGDPLHHHRPLFPVRHHGSSARRPAGDGKVRGSHGPVRDRHSGHEDPLDLRVFPTPQIALFPLYLLPGFLDRHHRDAGCLLLVRAPAVRPAAESGGTVIFRVDRDLSFAYDKSRNCMRERLGEHADRRTVERRRPVREGVHENWAGRRSTFPSCGM